jgi:transposase
MPKKGLPIQSFPFTRQGFDRLYRAYTLCMHKIAKLEASDIQKTAQVKHHFLHEKRLTTQGDDLQRKNQLLTTDLNKVLEQNRKLRKKNLVQQAQIIDLTKQLRIAKIAKNSSNSGRPPSTDMFKPARKTNSSLRKKTGRKTGGQPGHAGSTLLFSTAIPDLEFFHGPAYCAACGNDLSVVQPAQQNIRQVVDIPPPKYVLTNHISYDKVCNCGHCNKGYFPENVRSHVGYGPELEALVANLHARQYIPYGRTATLIEDLYGISISEGTVANMLQRYTQKASVVYDDIQKQVYQSEVVGADETGAKVNGNTHWFHVYQTPELTFIGHHPSRGIDGREAFFPNGLPHSILVTDCLAMQLSTPAKGHQVCLSAHIMRELKAIEEEHPDQQWPLLLKKLFEDALELKKQDHTLSDLACVEQRFDLLLNMEQSDAPGKIAPLWKRMVKHCDKIFTFLYHQNVPSDNNASERAIRNVKVKTKVSGQFKSDEGAQQYAVVRSVIDTTDKQNKNVHDVLALIAHLVPK